MQKQITQAALALSALLLTACAAAPVESVATVETAPEPAPQVLTAYAADGLAPALQAYADAQGVALNWTDDASTASLLALDHQPDGIRIPVAVCAPLQRDLRIVERSAALRGFAQYICAHFRFYDRALQSLAAVGHRAVRRHRDVIVLQRGGISVIIV